MSRQQGRKKTPETKSVWREDEHEDHSSDNSGKSDDMALARRALFAAVEGDVGGCEEDDDDASESLLSPLHSPKALVRLFEPSTIGGKTKTSLKPGLSGRDQRKYLLKAIRGFCKSHARRYFAGLKSIVEKVIESAEYLLDTQKRLFSPDLTDGGSHDEDDNDSGDNGEENQSGVNDDSDDIDGGRQDKKSSEESLVFLHLAATCVQSYLDGCIERRKQQLSRLAIGIQSTMKPAREIKLSPQLTIIEEALEVAVLLHSVLFELRSQCGQGAAVRVINTIVRLCESWWLANASQKEQLTVQALPLMVKAASESNVTLPSQKAQIRRLYKMRQALELIDFEDPSSDSLRDMLVSLAASPLCLRLPEGKRFLAYLFHADLVLLKDVHQAIRAQIPGCRASLQKVYGDIYWTAWNEAPSPEIQRQVEEEALSDLFYLVLHAAKPKTAKSVRNFLAAIHRNKKVAEVEDMLLRMYGPILWRSLTASNALVRVNAGHVLAQVFPLQDSSHKNTKAAVQKACTAVEKLMEDVDPRVRVAGSQATAFILKKYWQVIPADNIRKFLNHIVTEHASDASSPTVRAASLNFITVLLEEKQTHPALRALLPMMGNLIHDRVRQVRVAAVTMLIRVKDTGGIQYYHVVPVDHLMARLADEGRHRNNSETHKTNPVASALTLLLLKSYFPQNQPSKVQIDRTLKFLQRHPLAASVFYANIHLHLPVLPVAKLAALLARCIYKCVETESHQQNNSSSNESQAKGRKRVRFSRGEHKETQLEEEDTHRRRKALTAADTSLMAEVAETMSTLLASIERELRKEGNEKCNAFLIEVFSGPTLINSLVYFERKAALEQSFSDQEHNDTADDATAASVASFREDCYRICVAILRAAGRLPGAAVEGLVPHITSVIQSSSEQEKNINNHDRHCLSAHVALLCLLGMSDEVAPALARSIEPGFGADHQLFFQSPASDSKKRKSGRGRSFKSTQSADERMAVPRLPPTLALDVLCDFFRGSDPTCVAARESIFSSETATQVIAQALEKGTVHAEQLLASDPAFSQSLSASEITFALRVCELFGRFTLHKEVISNQNEIHLSSQAEKILKWTSEKVVPALGRPDAPFVDPDLSRISMENSFYSTTTRGSLPVSPASMCPLRRRANRNSTPESRRTGLSSFGFVTSRDAGAAAAPTNLVARAFAVSTMQSSCVVFSEWLAVGGGSSVAEKIVTAASKWTKVFKEEDAEKSQKELLPGFCRLAYQLCCTGQQFGLLKDLLIRCEELGHSDEAQQPVRNVIVALLGIRGSQASVMATRTVECLLDAAYHLIDKNSDHFAKEVQSLSDGTSIERSCNGWNLPHGCISSGLASIAANKQASLALARRLTEGLNETCQSTRSAKATLFDVQCLWLLSSSNSDKDFEAAVRGVNVEQLEQNENNQEACKALNELLNELA